MVNGSKCINDDKHVLRTRYGHCVECRPATLAHQGRKNISAHTYLGGSRRSQLLKIGMAADPRQREGVLNSLAYGGANDWQLLAVVKTEKAGSVEFEAQRSLTDYQVEANYRKDGREQACYEIFRCSHEIALNALRSATALHGGVFIMEATPNGHYGT